MAKTYAAELLLKNKSLIESLNQFIKKTKELKKEFSKPIEVNAKMGSSFKNVQANINRIAPKTKSIKIEATENVTKTMNNVNRSMFEMSNKMNSTINSSMKGFSSTLSASLPKIQAIGNTMASIVNTSKVMSSVAGASAMAGAGVGMAGATALNNKNNNYDSDKKTTGIAQPKSKKATVFEAFVGGWRDSVKKAKHIYENALGEIMADSKDAFYSTDSYFGQMIDRQKKKLRELGEINPLKKYQMLQVPTGEFDIDENEQADAIFQSGYEKVPNKIVKSYRAASEKIKEMFRGMTSTIGNYFTTKLSKPISWMKNQFNKVTTWTTNIFNKCWNGVQKTGLKAAYVIERGFYHLGSATFTIYNKIVGIFSKIGSKIASYIPEPIKRAFNKVDEASKKSARQAFRAFADMTTKVGNSITKNIGSAFSKLYNKAKSIATGIAATFAGAFAFGVNDVNTQEQYITSMSHFISVDDAKRNGENTITTGQAQERAEGLFNWGTDYANDTPFQNGEVYSAINRMTQVFGYGEDGSEIEKMVKLVGDMAALNPSKTMSDAAEAIADLAVGETERMKEFGLKLTQEDLKALAGVPDQSDSLSQEQIMAAFVSLTSSGGALFETFDGGAESLSQTVSGKWSTVMGKTRQMMVDSIKPFQQDFRDILDKAIGYLDGEFGEKFKSKLGKVFQGVKDIATVNKDSEIPLVRNILNAFETLKTAISPIIENIKSKFGETGIGFETVGKLIENVAGGISSAINFLSSVINGLINVGAWLVNAFAEHPGLFKTIAVSITGLAVLGPIISLVSGAVKVFQVMTTIINGVKAAFTILNILGLGPIVLGIGAVIAAGVLLWKNWNWVCEKASELWDWLKDLWALFKETPIGEFVDGVLQKAIGGFKSLVDWVKDACGWVGELWGKFKDSNWNPFNWFNKDDSSQNAYGKGRVPYDGYKASLHEGERILTSRQAAQMDAGMLPGQGGNVTNTISININGANDPDTTARLVVQRLKETLENTSVKSFA